MNKSIYILEEGILDFFSSKKPTPPTKTVSTPPPPPKEKELLINGIPVTIEGISNDGKGYTVWAGNEPMGDNRGEFNSVFDNGYKETNDKIYYYVTDIQDHVRRKAYFTVSAPKSAPGAEQTVKKIADTILKTKRDYGISVYHALLALQTLQ